MGFVVYTARQLLEDSFSLPYIVYIQHQYQMNSYYYKSGNCSYALLHADCWKALEPDLWRRPGKYTFILGISLTILPSHLSYPYFPLPTGQIFLLIFSLTLSYCSCICISLHKPTLERGKVPVISVYLLASCCQHEPFTICMINDNKSSHLSSYTSLFYKTIYDP